MAKNKEKLPKFEPPKEETHMQVFARLAAVKNMHGTPGDRKPRGK